MERKKSRPFQVVVFSAVLLAVGIGLFFAGRYIYCHRVAVCTPVSREVGPDIMEEQYALALQDIDCGRYDLAKMRLEFILLQNPDFPGAEERLAEVREWMLTP